MFDIIKKLGCAKDDNEMLDIIIKNANQLEVRFGDKRNHRAI